MKYRKKPVVIEAMKWDGHNSEEICNWCKDAYHPVLDTARKSSDLYIDTLEGQHLAAVGDMIIKGVKGEFYPCKPGIFAATYDKVEDDPPMNIPKDV